MKRKCTALEQSKFLTSAKCFSLRILELVVVLNVTQSFAFVCICMLLSFDH